MSNKKQDSTFYNQEPTFPENSILTQKYDDDDESSSSSDSDEDNIIKKDELVKGGAPDDDDAEASATDADADDDDEDEDEDDVEDEDDEPDVDIDEDEEEGSSKKKSSSKKTDLASVSNIKVKSKKVKVVTEVPLLSDDDLLDDENDYDDEDDFLQKFERETNDEYLLKFHPESKVHNYDEVQTLATVVRDKNNQIIDPLHKTIPILTKYEKARVLGIRAKQINNGAKTFLPNLDINIIDGYVIASLELEQRLIPFIIRRPLPNGISEYWRLSDLQIIS